MYDNRKPSVQTIVKRVETDEYKQKIASIESYKDSVHRDPKISAIMIESDERISKVRALYTKEITKAHKQGLPASEEKRLVFDRNVLLGKLDAETTRKIEWYRDHGNLENYDAAEFFEPISSNQKVKKNKYRSKHVTLVDEGVSGFVSINRSRQTAKLNEKKTKQNLRQQKRADVSERKHTVRDFNEDIDFGPKREFQRKYVRSIANKPKVELFIDNSKPGKAYTIEEWDEKFERESYTPVPKEILRSYEEIEANPTSMKDLLKQAKLDGIIHFNKSAIFKAEKSGAKHVFLMRADGEKTRVRMDKAEQFALKISLRLEDKARRAAALHIEAGADEDGKEFEGSFSMADLYRSVSAYEPTEEDILTRLEVLKSGVEPPNHRETRALSQFLAERDSEEKEIKGDIPDAVPIPALMQNFVTAMNAPSAPIVPVQRNVTAFTRNARDDFLAHNMFPDTYKEPSVVEQYLASTRKMEFVEKKAMQMNDDAIAGALYMEECVRRQVTSWLDKAGKGFQYTTDLASTISAFVGEFLKMEKLVKPMEWLKDYLGDNIVNAVVDIVSISCLVYLLKRSRNYLDITVVVTSYLLGHGLDPAKKMFVTLIEKLSSLFSFGSVYTEAGEEDERMSVGNSIKGFGGFISTIFNSEFATAVKTLVLSVVALKWIPLKQVKVIYSVLGKPMKMNIIEITTSLLESLGSLIGMAEAMHQGVPFSKYIASKDPITEWFLDCDDVLAKKGKTYTGLPVKGKFCRTEYRKQLGDLIVLGDDLLKRIGNSPFETRKQKLKRTLEDINTAAYEVDEYVATHKRSPPIILVLSGDPAIGKSLLVEWFLRIICAAKGWTYTPGMMFSKGRETEYWDGMDPSSNPFIFMSELGNTSNTLAMKEIDKELIALQSLCDTLPFICNMAFGEKGKIYANPLAIIVDTNNPDLHLQKQVFNQAAFKRRMWYLSVTVKSEFQVQGGTSLDKEKSMRAGGNLLDRYSFALKRYTANGDIAVLSDSFGELDISQATVELYKRAVSHIEHNDKIVRELDYSFVDDILRSEVGSWDAPLIPVAVPEKFANGIPIDTSVIDFDFMELAPMVPMDEEKVFTEAGDFPVLSNIDEFDDLVSRRARALRFRAGDDNIRYWFKFIANYYSHVADVLAYSRDLLFYCFLFCIWASRVTTFGKFFISKISYVIILLALVLGFETALFYCISGFVVCSELITRLSFRWYVYFFDYMVIPRLKMYMDFYAFKLGFKKPDGEHEEAMLASASHPYAFVKFAGVVVILGTIAALLRKFFVAKKSVLTEGNFSSFEQQTEVDPEIRKIEIVDGVSKNVAFAKMAMSETWNKVHLERISTFNGDPKDLYQSLSRNMRYVAVRMPGKETGIVTHIFGVKGTFALINKHVFSSKPVVHMEIFQGFQKRENEKGQNIIVKFSECVPVSQDIVLFNTYGQHFSDVCGHFVSGKFTRGSGIINGHDVYIRRENLPLDFTDAHDPASSYTSDDYFTYETNHKPGMCGRPLIAKVDTHGCAIIGLHSGGCQYGKASYAMPIERSSVEKAVVQLVALHPQRMQVFSEGVLESYANVGSKSPVNYIDMSFIRVEGRTNDRVCIKKTSKLENTPYHMEVDDFMEEEFGFVPTEFYGRPTMMPGWKDGVYIDPYVNGLNKMNVPTPPLDGDIMDKVISEYTNHIIQGLESKGISKLSPISFLEAVNGVENDPFISRINASTSGAYGFPGAKSNYMPLNEDQVTREPTIELRKAVLKIIKSYEEKRTANPLYAVQLKDEPREISRCASGQTRLFYMSPLDHLIVSRMYLSPFYAAMVAHSEVFCAAIGINIHSGAHHLSELLTSFAKKFLEWDYSGFDVANSYYIGWMWSSIICNVYLHFGFNDSAMNKVTGLLSDAIFSFIIMNADVYSKVGLVRSGEYATAEGNTGKGLCMLMYVWYANPNLAHLNFFEHVLPVLYGDDCLIGIKVESEEFVLPYFNNFTYKADCLKYFGMKTTPAHKGEDFQEYLQFEDVSFLKRNFVWNEEFERYIAPLDLHSICKSLHWYMPSTAVTREHQTISSLTSSLWELFFHCKNREQFERVRKYYIGLLKRHFENNDGEYLLPTYIKIGSSTGCFVAEKIAPLERSSHDGDGSAFASFLAKELSASKDSLIPSFCREDELTHDFAFSSQIHNMQSF